MSRFGSTATFYYASATDTMANSSTVILNPEAMPNYPFETEVDTDRKWHETKTGRKYVYQNYSLQKYNFNWSNISSGYRGSLKAMYDSLPILTFFTNGSLWGTFRLGEDSWQDSETSFDLYDVSLTLVEAA